MNRQVLVTDEGVVDAIVGYRMWRAWAVDGVVHMSSVSRVENEWAPGKPLYTECQCIPPVRGFETRPFSGGHTCGVYAWKDPLFPRTLRVLDPGTFIYIAGEVLLWGRVYVHERGYRSGAAKPSAFYVTNEMSRRQRTFVELCALQWGVPVVLVEPPHLKHLPIHEYPLKWEGALQERYTAP